MTRKDFIKACGLLGLHMPFYPFTMQNHRQKDLDFPHKIMIIGAGAAGLSAGYLLKQKGIDFTILEAASQLGGRMQIDTAFADFPIALGAEWISMDHINFNPLVDTQVALKEIQTIGYSPNDVYGVWANGKLIRGTLNTFNDKKFKNNSWLGFFKTFIAPSIQENIKYNESIHSIDHSQDKISLVSNNGVHMADRVILTVPLSILKAKDIKFTPGLPKKKVQAFEDTDYWDGFKAFFAFKEKFYPSFVDYVIQPKTDGQMSLYDAAWGQDSKMNVLGLFSVGTKAREYGNLSEDEFKKEVLEELDRIFDGKASRNYIKHMTHNWSTAAYAKGAYVSDFTAPRTIAKLQEPIEDKIHFAGDAYTDGTNWGNVHDAIRSAKQCVDTILNSNK